MRREQEAAFEEFVAGSGTRLLRLAVLLIGDRGHAEDVVQTALERTARHWSKLDGAPEAYARTVIANLVTDRWRRRAVRVHEVYVDLSWSAFDARCRAGAGPAEPLQADLAGRVALRSALIAALHQLPPRQRAVVVLRYFADLSEAETAAALGVTPGTVKSTTSRALTRLRDSAHLTDESTDEPGCLTGRVTMGRAEA